MTNNKQQKQARSKYKAGFSRSKIEDNKKAGNNKADTAQINERLRIWHPFRPAWHKDRPESWKIKLLQPEAGDAHGII